MAPLPYYQVSHIQWVAPVMQVTRPLCDHRSMGTACLGNFKLPFVAGLALAAACVLTQAQTLPKTQGETLSGKQLVLANAVQGHFSVIISSFSKDAGASAENWSKAVHQDPALAGVAVYQAAMLERAPGFIRGLVKAGLRKQVPAALQDNFVILVQDEPLWRSYFGVTADKEAYVVLLNGEGRVLWHGHGDAKTLEPLLKSGLH